MGAPVVAQLHDQFGEIGLVGGDPGLVGGLRFADGWLPSQVGAEIARRSDLPRAPSASPTPPTAAPLHDAATAVVPFATVLDPEVADREDVRAPLPEAREGRGPARRGSRRRTALIAAAALVLGAGGTFLFLHP
ncbi:hypothetical protein ACFWJ4_06255 [Kitasatospora sp. NPDC127067]|uniref:hypothetical protein n=1 Tax=Kitasatospora sp. NPDC127067 TaxID=3347126 RepID=UPI00364D5416